MSERRVGVYICYCGGNISDYVDCERVRDRIEGEQGVVVAKTTMFACSDASQQEMIDDIKEQKIDAMVVASCSPTLHLFTFRGVAERAGLNPYLYIQVNLREQCSWAHTDVPEQATEKAVMMVRAGIAKARLTQPLTKIRIRTVPGALVVGAGISGLRAALALSDLGISVFVVEKTDRIGGWVAGMGRMYPHDRRGSDLIANLVREIDARENIQIYSRAELVEKSGSVGDFDVKLDVGGESISLNVGAILVTTGFASYQPAEGEYAYGNTGVLTLPEFKELLDGCDGELTYQGKKVNDVSYIYCVGSREQSGEGGHEYCSRYCCNAAMHASSVAHDLSPGMHQFHLFRDVRTYGKYELLYQEARRNGAVFIKFGDEDPPEVEQVDGHFEVRVKDVLTFGEDLEIACDLVVLVTAMEPAPNTSLNEVLKLPIGLDGFFKEIHPKLRPVETVINGVFIAGAAQAPRNSSESVASALAATSKSAALLKKGFVELEPLIATVDADACSWCDDCSLACPYEAIVKKALSGGKEIAEINEALCKGCGCCVPACPEGALSVRGYTDQQIRAMIDAMEAGP